MTLFASAASEMIVSAMVMRWLKSATPGGPAMNRCGGRFRGPISVARKKCLGKIDMVFQEKYGDISGSI